MTEERKGEQSLIQEDSGKSRNSTKVRQQENLRKMETS